MAPKGLEALGEILERSGEKLPEEILDLEGFLGQSPLFSALDTKARKELGKKAKYRFVAKGETLIKEGTRGETFAIVKSGKLSVDATFEGQTKRLAVLGPGSVVGEVAVLMGTPRTATVGAQTDVELYEFRGDDIRPLMKQYPEVRKRLEALVERRTDETIEIFLGRGE